MRPQREVMDTGYAWVVLACAFLCHMIVASSWSSFGLYYIEFLDSFPERTSLLAWMWAILGATWGLAGLVVGKLITVFGSRTIATLGAVLGASGFLVTAFCYDFTFICLWYGLSVGFANCAIVSSAYVAVQQCFDKKRAFANGLSTVGGNAGLFAFPPLFELVIATYGWRGSFIIQSGLYLNVLVAASLFYPHRNDPGKETNHENQAKDIESNSGQGRQPLKCFLQLCKVCREICWCDKDMVTDCSFLLYAIAYFSYQFGHHTPMVFIVPRASTYGILPQTAAWLMSSWAIGGTFGFVVIGWIADRCDRMVTCALSSLMAGIFTAGTCWFRSFPLLCSYSVAFGLASGGFFATNIPALVDVVGADRVADANGMVLTPSGIAGLVAAPLSSWLTIQTGSYYAAFIVAGGMMVVGGFSLLITSGLRWRKTKQGGKMMNRSIVNIETVSYDVVPTSDRSTTTPIS